MNNFVKKSLATLLIVALPTGVFVSCAKNKTNNVGDLNNMAGQETLGEIPETIVDAQGNVVINTNKETQAETTEAEVEEGTKKVGKIELYKPVDFSTVTDFQSKYDELIVKREKYSSAMKNVVGTRLLYSQEEVYYAIYNVVTIDSDLSSLLVKIYEQTKEDVEDDIYLADQIEKLENVLNEIKSLQSKIEESKNDYADALNDITEASAKQIETVHKFSLIPLKAPVKYLEREIPSLKEELEEALSKQ